MGIQNSLQLRYIVPPLARQCVQYMGRVTLKLTNQIRIYITVGCIVDRLELALASS